MTPLAGRGHWTIGEEDLVTPTAIDMSTVYISTSDTVEIGVTDLEDGLSIASHWPHLEQDYLYRVDPTHYRRLVYDSS
jgi:hypothetical protein